MTWITFAILSAFFASLVAIFGKIGLKEIDPTFATTIRSIVMASFLFLISVALGKWHNLSEINSKIIILIILSGIAGALSWLFYFVALKTGPAPAVAALDRLSVVFVIVLAALFLGENLTWKTAIAGVLITTGAILMVSK